MRAPAKVGLVALGYVGAVLVALAIVALYIAYTDGADRPASGGMHAFGDGLLFLAVFGVAAVPATVAALVFLREYRRFWLVLSVAGLVIAGTGLAAFICYLATRTVEAGSNLHSWSALAILRILVAPLFALGFFLSGVFAPNRGPRIALFVATVVEAAVFAYVAVLLVHPFRP